MYLIAPPSLDRPAGRSHRGRHRCQPCLRPWTPTLEPRTPGCASPRVPSSTKPLSPTASHASSLIVSMMSSIITRPYGRSRGAGHADEEPDSEEL
eukprot:7381569-Prymnesium_polylepis.1